MNEITTVVNRPSALDAGQASETPTAGEQTTSSVELVASLGDLGALRGVTETAADLAECECPEPCERDHANE